MSIELNDAQQKKAFDLYNGILAAHQDDKSAALVHLCRAFALITSTQKDDREAGKAHVREWTRQGKELENKPA